MTSTQIQRNNYLDFPLNLKSILLLQLTNDKFDDCTNRLSLPSFTSSLTLTLEHYTTCNSTQNYPECPYKFVQWTQFFRIILPLTYFTYIFILFSCSDRRPLLESLFVHVTSPAMYRLFQIYDSTLISWLTRWT